MRIESWDVRLAEIIEAVRDKPFEWGQHDCTIWAMGVRLALRGDDSEPEWLGKYSSAIGAVKFLKEQGYENLEGAGRSILGDPIPPLLAQRGDICLTTDPNGEENWPDLFGVCIGEKIAVVAEDGLTAFPIMSARLAWRT